MYEGIRITDTKHLSTNTIAPFNSASVRIQGDLIIEGGATISIPNKSLTVQNLTVENLSIGEGKIDQSRVAGLEDALDGKQSIISVINGIQDYYIPRTHCIIRSYLPQLGNFNFREHKTEYEHYSIQADLLYSSN